ncbi:hypothetical protein MPER_07201, partial [Moniliophthora perniciosa FA553]
SDYGSVETQDKGPLIKIITKIYRHQAGHCNLGSFFIDIQFKTQGITNVGGAKVHRVTWVLGKGFRGLGKGFMWSGAEGFGSLRLLLYKLS